MAKFRRAPYVYDWIGGVCSGLAYALEIPAWLVRLLVVVFALAIDGGSLIVIYILLWVFVPRWNPAPEDFEEITDD